MTLLLIPLTNLTSDSCLVHSKAKTTSTIGRPGQWDKTEKKNKLSNYSVLLYLHSYEKERERETSDYWNGKQTERMKWSVHSIPYAKFEQSDKNLLKYATLNFCDLKMWSRSLKAVWMCKAYSHHAMFDIGSQLECPGKCPIEMNSIFMQETGTTSLVQCMFKNSSQKKRYITNKP